MLGAGARDFARRRERFENLKHNHALSYSAQMDRDMRHNHNLFIITISALLATQTMNSALLHLTLCLHIPVFTTRSFHLSGQHHVQFSLQALRWYLTNQCSVTGGTNYYPLSLSDCQRSSLGLELQCHLLIWTRVAPSHPGTVFQNCHCNWFH